MKEGGREVKEGGREGGGRDEGRLGMHISHRQQ